MDQIQNFIFEDQPVRGSVVQLDSVTETILSQQNYPTAVSNLLMQTLVSVAMLFGISKQSGKMTLQFQGEGLIRLISARCTHEHRLRGLAQWSSELPEDIGFAEALGGGQLVMTYQSDATTDVFQSIIEITGDSIADTMAHYFAQSEQLKTDIQIFAKNGRAAGFFLQSLPDEAYKQEVSFEHAMTMARTLQPKELMNESPLTLLNKLYHEDNIRVFEPLPLQFGCDCSIERMGNAIRTMGRSEAEKVLEEHDAIEVTCEFCQNHFAFDRVQVEKLFEE